MKLVFIVCSLFLMGYLIKNMFFENKNLTKHSINNDIVSISEVVSMGRDDDDGKSKKWHIGGQD